MSLNPDDFPMKKDDHDAFLHGIVITFDGCDEWSLYDDVPLPAPPTPDSNPPTPKPGADNSGAP